MLTKKPSFGQRAAIRQPTLVRRLSEPADVAPLVSHVAAPLHAPTARAEETAAVEAVAEPVTEPVTEAAAAPVMAMPLNESDNQGAEARWARRTPSRLGAQVQHHSLISPIACTIRDTSSTGARLEVIAQRGGNISRDRIPDQFTLFMPADRLEVDCQVMWRQGAMVGVRYTSPARRTAKQQPIKKPEAPKKPHTSLINLLINPL